MNKKSTFFQIILLIAIALVCIVLTVGLALIAGSADKIIFDFRNLNIANMLPVLIVGGFVSCVVIGISVLFVSRSVFFKVKDYLTKTEDKGDEEK